jgi:hypothetical protein
MRHLLSFTIPHDSSLCAALCLIATCSKSFKHTLALNALVFDLHNFYKRLPLFSIHSS